MSLNINQNYKTQSSYKGPLSIFQIKVLKFFLYKNLIKNRSNAMQKFFKNYGIKLYKSTTNSTKYSFIFLYNLFYIYTKYKKNHLGLSFYKNFISLKILANTYQGHRLKLFLPTRGQRTRSNRKTARYLRKGRIFLDRKKNYDYIVQRKLKNLRNLNNMNIKFKIF